MYNNMNNQNIMNNNMDSPNNNNFMQMNNFQQNMNQMNNNMFNNGDYNRKRHIPHKDMSIVPTVLQDSGLDKNEVNSIKNIVQLCYSSIRQNEFLSDFISKSLKQQLKGEWFVFACNADGEFPFCISAIPEEGYLIIKLGDSKIQIARIK